jgi:hypothetical protein
MNDTTVENMNAYDKYHVLTQAWLIANAIIRKHGTDSEVAFDAARLMAAVERLDHLFVGGEG